MINNNDNLIRIISILNSTFLYCSRQTEVMNWQEKKGKVVKRKESRVYVTRRRFA